MKYKKYIQTTPYLGLLLVFLLQIIWFHNALTFVKEEISNECASILNNALYEEVNIISKGLPEGTMIIGGKPNDSISINTYLYDGIIRMGYTFSINRIDSLVDTSLKNKEINIDYTICIINLKDKNSIQQSSKHMDCDNKIFDTFIETEPIHLTLNNSLGITMRIFNPYLHVFKEMWIIFLTTIIIIVLIIICIIWQQKYLFYMKKIFAIREDFSYAMIHDMKTPLSTIFMTLNFLHTGRLDNKPEKKEKYFQIAEGEADHLLTLTNKVLTISKLEKHKLEMHKEELELEPIIDKLIDKFTAKSEKPVHFIKDLQAEVIYADEEFLGEVLSNLIDNAIKYSKESVEITLSSTSNELYTILKVHDNGLGISDEDQKVIFNKYERAAAGRQKRKKGSSGFGLGLNFVQQVVEAHEGKIIVNSIEGEFTEFIIYLPQIIQKL